MKKIVSIILLIVSLFSITCTAFADTLVNDYHRKDGTRVRGHWRSDADGIESNNWSHHGNVNPHTGKRGTRW